MLTRVVLIFALSCPFIYAADPGYSVNANPSDPPTEASVKQLLELAQAEQNIKKIEEQMIGFMKQTMAQAIAGQKITPEIQKDVDRREQQMEANFHELLDWQKLEPLYTRVYQKSFTQGELNGIIDFYKTPAGQALIAKLPTVMQNTLNEVQQMMQPVLMRMRQQQQEVIAEIKKKNPPSGG